MITKFYKPLAIGAILMGLASAGMGLNRTQPG